jgi:chromate transporter
VSFGGAYTAIPVVQQSTVTKGWITNQQFLDGLGASSQPADLGW